MKEGLFRGAVLVLVTGTCAFSIWTFAETRKAVVAAESAKEAAAGAKSSATVSQEQAVQTRQEAEAAKEAAKRAADEAEQTRKAADEALKKITLYKDFREGVSEVRKDYVSGLKTAEEELRASLDSLEELARQRFILWASKEDSFLSRFRFSEAKTKAGGEQMVVEVFSECLDQFNDAVQQAEHTVRGSLYLSEEQFPSSGHLVVALQKSGPKPEASSVETSIDSIAGYASSPLQTIGAIGEETFTFVPWAGSAYDVSRLAWDWRMEVFIMPSANAFAAAIVKRVEDRVQRDIQQRLSRSDELFEGLASLHTPATLYAAYEASLR